MHGDGMVDMSCVESDGIKHHVRGEHNPALLDPAPGEHVWTALAVYRVNPQRWTEGPAYLDPENLAGIRVACWVCEQSWTGQTGPCPGAVIL